MELMKQFSQKYMKEDVPEVNVGDTVRVHIRVKEGSRERIQVFEGTVIAKKPVSYTHLSGQFNYQNTFKKHHNVSAMLIANGYQ